ncbi:growth factor receptor-bound protein 14-like isoform X2 [Branchiostoma floridae x Branchiostoma belcheri]
MATSETRRPNMMRHAGLGGFLGDIPLQETQVAALTHQDDDVDLDALIRDMNFEAREHAMDKQPVDEEHTPLLATERDTPNNSFMSQTRPSRPVHINLNNSHSPNHRISSSPINSPPTPNPFPDLPVSASPTSWMTSPRTASAPRKDTGSSVLKRPTETSSPVLPRRRDEYRDYREMKRVSIRIHKCDGTSKAVDVGEQMTAREVCSEVALRCRSSDEKNCVLMEHIVPLGLERNLEDHEKVLQVCNSWGRDSSNKMVFKKDFRKYEVFCNPSQYFPEDMVTNFEEIGSHSEKAEMARNLQLLNLLATPGSVPNLQGWLHVRDAHKKNWKKVMVVIKGSGLYYSTKGNSMEPRHLHCFSAYSDCDIYTATQGKKVFGAPTEFCFCIKPSRQNVEKHDIKCLCAEDERTRQCWLTAFRISKYGQLLYKNYELSKKSWKFSDEGCPSPIISPVSETRRESFKNGNKIQHEWNLGSYRQRVLMQESQAKEEWARSPQGPGGKNRVAMDFTGYRGRVIANPNEAVAVAVEEGQSWRKRHSSGSRALVGSPRNSPLLSPRSSRFLSSQGVHQTQPWFHHGINRDEANNMMHMQGMVDGLYLVRESQTFPGTFVLTFCHDQRVKHYQIQPTIIEDKTFYSLDEGETKFGDLVQLVEFYQINRGALPHKLTHPCTGTGLRWRDDDGDDYGLVSFPLAKSAPAT